MVAETGAVMDAVAATDERRVRAGMRRRVIEIACKTADLAEKVAADGGIAGLVQCLAYDRGDKRSMFAAQTLGYVADFKPSLAMAVVGVDRGRCLVEALDHAPGADRRRRRRGRSGASRGTGGRGGTAGEGRGAEEPDGRVRGGDARGRGRGDERGARGSVQGERQVGY